MAPIVETRCPGCQATLRIPAEWVAEPLRCKHCGLVSLSKGKGSALAPAAVGPESAPAPEPVVAAADQKTTPPPPPPSFSQGPGTFQKVAFVGLWLLGVAALGVAYYWANHMPDPANANQAAHRAPAPEQPPTADPPAAEKPPDEPPPPEPQPEPPPPQPGPNPEQVFPRRLLAVGLHRHVFANPIGDGLKVSAVADQLAQAFHIPPTQVVKLVDEPGQPPLRKEVIEDTLTRFLDGCRTHDRIILLLVGHLIEVDGQGYLLPIEGERTDKSSLIPLFWLYQRLGKCRAAQKLLILDTCRHDPTRGEVLPGSAPLSPRLAELLLAPPPTVQVWTACAAEQASLENQGVGIFLQQLDLALRRFAKIYPGRQRPPDPFPLTALLLTVNRQTQMEAQRQFQAEQLPVWFGEEAMPMTSYNPQDPLPPPLAVTPPPAPEGSVPLDDVRAILHEIMVPSIALSQPDAYLASEALAWFDARDLRPYAPDVKETPLRQTVVKARDLLREELKTPLRRQFFIQVKKKLLGEIFFKGQVEDQGKLVAKRLLPLMEILEELKAFEEQRGQESKRWQAHYDYTRAQVMIYLAFLQEYQYQLGQLRRELPERDPDRHDGWQLAAQERMSINDRDVRRLASEAKERLDQLILTHPGTPWSHLARRDRHQKLGLTWQPIRGE
ncbi:MAG: caspase family protein [Gemmataceae bacterium]